MKYRLKILKKQKPGRKRKYTPVKEPIVEMKKENKQELREEVQNTENEKKPCNSYIWYC